MEELSGVTARPPFVEGRAADPMLAAQFGHGKPTLSLTQHGHDLGFSETCLLHRNLLVQLAEKILRSHPLNHGEDYHPTEAELEAEAQAEKKSKSQKKKKDATAAAEAKRKAEVEAQEQEAAATGEQPVQAATVALADENDLIM